MHNNTKALLKTDLAPNNFFLRRIYNETMDMLMEARSYFEHRAALDQNDIPLHARIIYATEATRITLRLSSAMAWILARRALAEGEITEEQLREQFGLQCKESCHITIPQAEHLLPEAVCDLLNRSHALYARIDRLDAVEAA